MWAWTSCSRFSTVSEATAQSSRCFWEMTSRLYSVPVKNIESSRARSLSNFFQVSKPVPPLRVWKSIRAVFRVFSFSASSMADLLSGSVVRAAGRRGAGAPPSEASEIHGRRLALPVREDTGDNLTDLRDREGLGQPRPGHLGEEAGHGGAQGVAGDEDHPAPQLGSSPLELAVEAWPVQDRHPEIAQDEIVLMSFRQGQRHGAVGGGVRLMSLVRQDLDEEVHDVELIVHHEDTAARRLSRGHLDATHGERLGWISAQHGATPRRRSNRPRGRYHTRSSLWNSSSSRGAAHAL